MSDLPALRGHVKRAAKEHEVAAACRTAAWDQIAKSRINCQLQPTTNVLGSGAVPNPPPPTRVPVVPQGLFVPERERTVWV